MGPDGSWPWLCVSQAWYELTVQTLLALQLTRVNHAQDIQSSSPTNHRALSGPLTGPFTSPVSRPAPGPQSSALGVRDRTIFRLL